MAVLAQGSFVDIVFTGDSTLTVQNPGGMARIEYPIGTTIWAGGWANVQLDMQAGTARIYAVTRPLSYFYSIDPPVALSVDQVLALQTMLTAGPVCSRVRRASNQAVATSGSYVDLVWDTAAMQKGGTFWTSGATLTIPVAGVYLVVVEATFDTTGLVGSPTCKMQVIVNGSTVIGDDEKMLILGASVPLSNQALRPFAAGDTIKVQVQHGNSATLNVLSQGDHSPDIFLALIK